MQLYKIEIVSYISTNYTFLHIFLITDQNLSFWTETVTDIDRYMTAIKWVLPTFVPPNILSFHLFNESNFKRMYFFVDNSFSATN